MSLDGVQMRSPSSTHENDGLGVVAADALGVGGPTMATLASASVASAASAVWWVLLRLVVMATTIEPSSRRVNDYDRQRVGSVGAEGALRDVVMAMATR